LTRDLKDLDPEDIHIVSMMPGWIPNGHPLKKEMIDKMSNNLDRTKQNLELKVSVDVKHAGQFVKRIKEAIEIMGQNIPQYNLEFKGVNYGGLESYEIPPLRHAVSPFKKVMDLPEIPKSKIPFTTKPKPEEEEEDGA